MRAVGVCRPFQVVPVGAGGSGAPQDQEKPGSVFVEARQPRGAAGPAENRQDAAHHPTLPSETQDHPSGWHLSLVYSHKNYIILEK